MFNFIKSLKHKGIERFFLCCVALVVMFSGTIFMMNSKRWKNVGDAIKYEPIFNGDIKMSKTDTGGKVLGVYTNVDKTKALVVLRFNDASMISTNAEDYRLFITPAKIKGNMRSKLNLGASIFSFGDSGYFGVLFTNADGFKNQLIQVIFRNDSTLNTDLGEDLSNRQMTVAESFKYYDQGLFYINLGAINTPLLKMLNEDDLNLNEVYSNVVLKSRDTDTRMSLDSTIEHLIETRKIINEYHDRLLRYSANGLTLLDTSIPEWVTEDVFEKYSSGEVIGSEGVDESESVNESEVETTLDTGSSTDKSDDVSDEVFDENYIYEPTYTYTSTDVFDGGIMFDWWKSDVIKGYGELVSAPSSAELLAYVKKIPDLKYEKVYSKTDWFMSDGTPVDRFIDENSNLDYVNTLATVMDTYNSYLNDYKNTKKDYQMRLLPKLLYLTLTKDNISGNYTINTNEHVLLEY